MWSAKRSVHLLTLSATSGGSSFAFQPEANEVEDSNPGGVSLFDHPEGDASMVPIAHQQAVDRVMTCRFHQCEEILVFLSTCRQVVVGIKQEQGGAVSLRTQCTGAASSATMVKRPILRSSRTVECAMVWPLTGMSPAKAWQSIAYWRR